MFAIIAHAFTDIDGKGAGTPRTAREHASSIFDKSAVDSVIPDIRTLNIQSTATASSRAPSFHFGPTSCATSWPTLSTYAKWLIHGICRHNACGLVRHHCSGQLLHSFFQLHRLNNLDLRGPV
jgi:hypothetical protein